MTIEDIENEVRSEGGFKQAGAFSRLTALIIDLVILYFVFKLYGATMLPDDGSIGFSLDATGILIAMIYYTSLEWSPLKGTIGKKLLRLRVVDQYGARLSFGKVMLRNISRLVTLFTLLIGFVIVFFRQDARTLHDIMSSTYVLTPDS